MGLVEEFQAKWREVRGDLPAMAEYVMERMKGHTYPDATQMLALALAVTRNPARSPKSGELWVESLVSARDQKPYVSIRFHDEVIQLSVLDARDHIKNLVEACEAAMADAFLCDFMQKKVGLDEGRLAAMLQEFRKFRVALEGE